MQFSYNVLFLFVFWAVWLFYFLFDQPDRAEPIDHSGPASLRGAVEVWRADGMGSTPVGRLRPKQVSAFLPDMYLITGCKASIRWGWSDAQIARLRVSEILMTDTS